MLKELQKAEDLFIENITGKDVGIFIVLKISHKLRGELRIFSK